MNTQELFKALHNCTYHYAIIPSNKIHNIVSIIFQDAEIMKRHLEKNKQQRIHFENLEKSMRSEGVRNPICVMAGFVPPIHQRVWEIENTTMYENLYCTAHGGSRLWIAQTLNMDVPCVIADYTGLFQGSKEYELQELMQFFVDKPQKMTVTRKGLMAWDLPNPHMKK